MTSRERIRKALNHEEADRVPFDLGSRSSAIEIEAYEELKRYFNLETSSKTFLRSHALIENFIFEKLGIDTLWIHAIPDSSWSSDDTGIIFTDRWGVPWKRLNGYLYYEIDAYPLSGKSQREILDNPWPELVSQDMLSQLERESIDLYNNTEYSISCDTIGAGIFERAWYLRGFEEFIIDMATDVPFVKKYLQKILDQQLSGYEKILNRCSKYIDTVLITDDVATQESMLISPEMYRSIIKPYQKELISYIQNRGVNVIFHSCGAIFDLIPDFIENGVHIIHPIQLSAHKMDTKELKREYGKEIVFWGGGCEIEILQNGSPEDVFEEVEKRIKDLGAEGGFVFTPTHCIQPGTPPENIIALSEALKEFGEY